MSEIWTLSQISDPKFRHSLLADCINFQGNVILEFTDGKIEVSKRWAFFNLFWLQVPVAFGIPLRKDHFIKRIPFEAEGLTNQLNRYYDEIMSLDYHHAKKLKQVLWQMLQELYELGSNDLLPYARTIDILDMAEIMTDPKVASIIETKEEITPSMGTRGIEDYIEEHRKQLMDLLGQKSALKNQALYDYQKISLLNKFQLPQTMYAFGVRTDINDNIVELPVIGSAIDGLRNIQEYAVESLSAKKSMAYNHEAVKDSQYFGRKQQLAASTIRKIYSGDCGSKVLLRYKVTRKNHINIVGKNVLGSDGNLFLVTNQNVGSLVDSTIFMRSPMTCRYRDGVCEVCGGAVISNINRKLSLGILSAIHVIEPTTQKILSAKHLIKTLSLVYELPGTLTDMLYNSSVNEISFKPAYWRKLKGAQIGVSVEDFRALHDVVYIRHDRDIKAEQYSSLKYFKLRTAKATSDKYWLEVPDQDANLPFFSPQMLLHMKENYKLITIEDDHIWIPLAGMEDKPIFKTVIVNDNMLSFVKQVSGFLSKRIRDYTSCSEALQDFSDLVHGKVNCNIVHLEVLLKAYEITSDVDYRVPVVEDETNVKFQNNPSILTNRYVGTSLAFQGLERYVSSPSTYLVPKPKSPFDLMIGYTD